MEFHNTFIKKNTQEENINPYLLICNLKALAFHHMLVVFAVTIWLLELMKTLLTSTCNLQLFLENQALQLLT